MFQKQPLIDLVRELALEFGEFTLASGKKASFYLDCRRVTLHPQGANLIADGILDVLDGQLPDAIGGMAIGADPITAAVITVAGQRGDEGTPGSRPAGRDGPPHAGGVQPQRGVGADADRRGGGAGPVAGHG